jgi:TMEM175 potassium channel family protein
MRRLRPEADVPRFVRRPLRILQAVPIFPRVTDDGNIPGIDRFLALTDGVVAIALTLLVLQLQVPARSDFDANSASQLWHALGVDGGELTSYLVSFVVIAQFWLVHHRILRTMRGHSEGLAWRNFAFLLALTLMPFTSDLMGRYSENPLAITFFAVNLVALSLTTQWIYHYAAGHDLLDEERRWRYEEPVGQVRSLLTIGVVSIALVLAWTDASYSRYVWLLFIFVPVVGSRIATRYDTTQNSSEPAST